MGVLTITINPSLDKSTNTDRIQSDIKIRCSAPAYDPGGGGINVSRVLHRLGTSSTALFPSGGDAGKKIEEFLAVEGVTFRAFKSDSFTRENTLVTEKLTGNQYRFTYPGVMEQEHSWLQFYKYLKGLKSAPNFIVASGSLPQGVPDTFYAELALIARDLGTRFILDTSGVPLQLALETKAVYFIKPNVRELETLVGQPLKDLLEIEQAALEVLQRFELKSMVVSLGAEGAVLVSQQGIEYSDSPKVTVKSAVGAGDSMVAGMVHYFTLHKSAKEILNYGIACGTATATTEGSQLCQKEMVEEFYRQLMRG